MNIKLLSVFHEFIGSFIFFKLISLLQYNDLYINIRPMIIGATLTICIIGFSDAGLNGHFNPAITISVGIVHGWKHVYFSYILVQCLAGLLAFYINKLRFE